MILTAENLSRSFIRDGKDSNVLTAVAPLSLSLSGQCLQVLKGRSGSGKTTLLNMLCGLLTPSGGRVLAGETDLYALKDPERSRFRNEHFGIVPQGQSALFALNVLENVLLPATIYKTGKGAGERAKELLERMGIWHLRNSMPGELSGGELRRMAIARALINDPEILFFDEPTSDLDDENTGIVFSILKELAASGKSLLVVTHETSADRFADVVLVMDAGVLKKP